MKTSQLIVRLNEIDPTGENEVCVGNCDINFIDKLPAYYDGKLQLLERDESGKPTYLKGYRISSGQKINLFTTSLLELAIERPNFEIIYDSEQDEKFYKAQIAQTKLEYRDLFLESDKYIFIDWAFIKLQSTCVLRYTQVKNFEELAGKWFIENVAESELKEHIEINFCRDETLKEYFNSNYDVFIDRYGRISFKCLN